MDTPSLHTQGPKDKSYETKEWEFAVIDVSITYYNVIKYTLVVHGGNLLKDTGPLFCVVKV